MCCKSSTRNKCTNNAHNSNRKKTDKIPTWKRRFSNAFGVNIGRTQQFFSGNKGKKIIKKVSERAKNETK